MPAARSICEQRLSAQPCPKARRVCRRATTAPPDSMSKCLSTQSNSTVVSARHFLPWTKKTGQRPVFKERIAALLAEARLHVGLAAFLGITGQGVATFTRGLV